MPESVKIFTKNPLALTGFVIIGIMILISVPGYLILPDKTPFSNDQNLSIAAKPPMFRVKMLPVKNRHQTEHPSLFKTMLTGREPLYTQLPVDSCRSAGDSVIIYEYSNSGLDGLISYKLSQSNVGQQVKEKTFILGTDRFGRDMLSRLVIGARVSLSIGLISVLISLIIGIPLGLFSGYYKGMTDSVISWVINVVWSVPSLLMALSITLILGKGFWQVFLAIGLTMWVEVARVVRGQVLVIRGKEYIEASMALGFSDLRILFRHILPNVMSPVIIISAGNFASAILIEAGLSFLGIGVQPPVPSWGNMIKDHYGYIILDKPFLAILPGVAIMLVVLAFNFIGNGLRDALDTRIR